MCLLASQVPSIGQVATSRPSHRAPGMGRRARLLCLTKGVVAAEPDAPVAPGHNHVCNIGASHHPLCCIWWRWQRRLNLQHLQMETCSVVYAVMLQCMNAIQCKRHSSQHETVLDSVCYAGCSCFVTHVLRLRARRPTTL